MKKLQGQELYRRLQEARNAKRLLQKAYDTIKNLEEQIVLLKEQNALQAEQIILQQTMIEQQALRIEYLEKIVFGKSKKNGHDQKPPDQGADSSSTGHKTPLPRDPRSYQRAIPKTITDTTRYPLEECPDCHGILTERATVKRYVEDILLPERMKNPLKKVEMQLIEGGWCPKCKLQKSAQPVNGSRVILGQNVKILVIYLVIIMRKTYAQVQHMFRDIYHLSLSDGEITKIMQEQSNRLSAEHKNIRRRIRAQPSHKDETSWQVAKGTQGNYCWINTGSKTTDTEFLVGRTRGKGNAQKLQGKSKQPIITDDYAAYNGISAYHQLCWAHPLRKLRELRESRVFRGEAHVCCETTYQEYKKLYEELRRLAASETTFVEKRVKKQDYLQRFLQMTYINSSDPQKLQTIKTTLRKDAEHYFTFLEVEGLPLDNNQAERRLRHIVLKRKISLGSKTDRGAKALETLFSVVLTWWWRDPTNFISNYRHLLA